VTPETRSVADSRDRRRLGKHLVCSLGKEANCEIKEKGCEETAAILLLLWIDAKSSFDLLRSQEIVSSKEGNRIT
jgi:hypothetical protein